VCGSSRRFGSKYSAFKFLELKIIKLNRALLTINVFLLLSFFSSALYASELNQPDLPNNDDQNNQKQLEDTSVFEKGRNAIYQFINDNEYIFTIVSGTIAGGSAGGQLCGVWCAVGGGVIGGVDELLIYSGYTDKRYLTWCLYGVASGHVIKPSIIFDVAGGVIGILLPTGILNNCKELVAPTVSAVAGNSIAGFGVVGGGLGGLAGVLDEAGIYTGITDKHYLTFCTVGIAVVNLLKYFNPVITNSAGIILGLIAVNYEEKTVTVFLLPVKTVQDLYASYSKFIPKEQLDAHMEKHAIALIGAQFLTQFLSLQVIKYQQSLTYNFERLDNPDGLAWKNLKSQMVGFVFFIFPYAIGEGYSSNIDDYFCKRLHLALENKVRNELFSGETALKLSQDTSPTVLMDNLKSDVSTIVNSGSWIVTGAISSAIGGVYGISIIATTSPRTFVYSVLYSKASSFISEYLSEQQRFYNDKITVLDSKLITTLKHDIENIRTITERDGVVATKWKIQQIFTELQELEESQKLWGIANRIWWPLSGTTDYMLSYYLIGKEISNKKISFEDRNKVQAASWKASNFLSWSGSNAREVGTINQSLSRINKLEEMMHVQVNSVDQINRTIQEGNQLVLQDLEIGIVGKTADGIVDRAMDRLLVTIKDLKLDMGKVYAITGETGCGKTSLLSKIKGIKENGIYGKGAIYYPRANGKNPKILMLSQQDYFPLDSSLYEIILYPNKIPSDTELNSAKRAEISSLMEEIGLHFFKEKSRNNVVDNNQDEYVENSDSEPQEAKKTDMVIDLDSKKNWYTVLSGGEKKKITIVSAIIKRPDVLILDEIFNGLDQESIALAQRMLKKYLPTTLILSVDHHARDNNYNFYDSELHFANKLCTLKSVGEHNILICD